MSGKGLYRLHREGAPATCLTGVLREHRRPAKRSAAPEVAGLRPLFGNHAVQSWLGGHDGSPCSCGGACAKCSTGEPAGYQEIARRLIAGIPGREPMETDDEEEEFPPRRESARPGTFPARECPTGGQDCATIVCNGAGGYEVDLGPWSGAKCGVEDCVRRHEESHKTDWETHLADGCRTADGRPKPRGATVPLATEEFAKKSECKAHTEEVTCEAALLNNGSPGCHRYVDRVLRNTRKKKNEYCGNTGC